MAKNPDAPEAGNEAVQPTDTNVAQAGADTAAAPAAAAASDSRSIQLVLDQEAVTALGDGRAVGSTMARKDYILKRWSQGTGRGPIAKELTRLQGKEIPYQIVFQATSKVPGGPQPAAAPAPAAPAEQAQPAAE